MLFNSTGFIYLFLPGMLIAYYLAARMPWDFARRLVLIAGTLVFYGIGAPQFVPLLLASVALNYLAARSIQRASHRDGVQRAILAVAITVNLLLLGYFKYFEFALSAFGAAFGQTFAIEAILLPLGISFFTFQQIGYLVDVSRKKAAVDGPLDYAGFVLFFPQLLAGPIVRHEETASQLRAPVAFGTVGRSILIGLAIFAIGLFKKTVIADTLALYATPIFAAAGDGGAVSSADAWIGAFAYTAQIYFDFSGYSDMAIGTARMFGIILPLNFHSPLRAASIAELWRRWHVTLSRWVQSYVFQPLALPLARWAAMHDLGPWGMLGVAVVLPTMIAMLIIGIWHGAGWTFVIFGLLQGIYIAANEAWSLARKSARKKRRKAGQTAPVWRDPLARAATLMAFVISIVPFASADVGAMARMFEAMAGLGPDATTLADWPLGSAGALATVVVSYLAIYLLPNTQQIMRLYRPVLSWSQEWSKVGESPIRFVWKMTTARVAMLAVVLFLGVTFVQRGSAEFIYFNF